MKRFSLIFAAVAILVFHGCKKDENLDREIVGLGGDTWPQTPLDEWLYANFTQPYNIGVKYRWDGTEYDNSKTLVPPEVSRVQPLMELVKTAWIDPYVDQVNPDFIKTYAPKNYVLVGSLQYNAGGTVTLGEAEGGIKVTLYNVNNFTNTDRAVSKRVLKTIHHEFTHILNQTIMYQKEFPYITPTGYTADWNNSSAYAANGFISQYSQASPVEDFAEMTSIMLTEGKLGYETLIKSYSSTALASVRKKEELVITYFKQVWGIDFYALQNRVQAALNSTAPEDITAYLGAGKMYTLLTPNTTIGMSADFTQVYNATKTGLFGYGSRVFNNFTLVYSNAGQVILRINYTNSSGSVLNANFTYDITTNANGRFTLTLNSRDGNANGIAPYVTALTDYLTQNQFVYRYFYSNDYVNMYIGLAKANDSSSYFYGTAGN
ncbi:hypothetical protein FW774_11855 [Pedobacter sp. BS3]|uniref:zinc-binding metallopeptidase n=1 Tax=Pedobacter sp. BS3 TaxID=2567937 RepID=UPI0011EE7777|nr:putative zinc-binding metallopeptidase [Pedobacter sp. BS3]TZF82992.1 hypothetical protein FW774_11855 [Pedobacter sp. BS3]